MIMDVCFNDPNSTFEGARMIVAGFPPQRTLPRAQQDRIDDQQDFIRKPMFEQRRCQRGATRKDNVRAVLRLDAANALDDVRSEALGRPPFKTFRTVGSDIFCCRIDAVRHRAARRLWPEARPDIVGATAKQQIEALAMRGEDCISAGRGPIGRGPVAVGKIAVIGGVLDHAVQRDVFHDSELSHWSLLVLGLGFLFCFAVTGGVSKWASKDSVVGSWTKALIRSFLLMHQRLWARVKLIGTRKVFSGGVEIR